MCNHQGSLLDTVGASLRSDDSTGGACHHAAPAAVTLRGARALGRKVVMLSIFVALSVSLTRKVSQLQWRFNNHAQTPHGFALAEG